VSSSIGLDSMGKGKYFPLAEIQLPPSPSDHPARSLVTIPTELSRLHFQTYRETPSSGANIFHTSDIRTATMLILYNVWVT
jgi:hypothetical protein